jgi:LuxR family maltose regulon positive regulatory protein
MMHGALDDAGDALAAGEFESGLAGNPTLQSQCVATAAIIDEVRGDHRSALERSRQADELLQSCGGQVLPSSAIVVAVTAMLLAHDERWDDSVRGIASARQSLRSFRSTAPWFNVIARVPLIRASLLLDDRELGATLMRELDHHARFEFMESDHSRHELFSYVAELGSRIDAMHLPVAGASALTVAELRVLRFLPTNLSLADIATRLFVSRNTVKTHAASIYRKLDAGNRRTAVEVARAAGLLTDDNVIER